MIRHGESYGNLEKNKIGQDADEPLTERGVNQSGRLGKRFLDSKIKFDKIFSSTYLRAKTTAEIFAKVVGHKENIIYSDKLVEYNPGNWKGQNRSEMYSDPTNYSKMINQHMHFLFPGGETYHQVARRVAVYVEENIIHNEEILAKAQNDKVNIAIFSHGMTIKSFASYAIGIDASSMWKVRIDNTAIQHLVFNNDGWFLYSLNDCGHFL